MRSIFYFTCVLRKLASSYPEFLQISYNCDLLGWEPVHTGAMSRKEIPTPSSFGDKSTPWLLDEIEGMLGSISLSAAPSSTDSLGNFVAGFPIGLMAKVWADEDSPFAGFHSRGRQR
jgi:hypothetical protein